MQKGVVFSEDHKKNLSEALTGRKLTEEHRRNIGKAGRGRKASKKELENRSKAHKGLTWKIDPEKLKKRSLRPGNNTGKKHSEETKEKIRNKKRGVIPWNKGRQATEAEVARLVEMGIKGRATQCGHNNTYRTGIECEVASYLAQRGIKFEEQKRVLRYICDFFLPDYKLVLECNGDYWHNLKEVQAKDKIKVNTVMEIGYDIISLTEKEINNGEYRIKLDKYFTDSRFQ